MPPKTAPGETVSTVTTKIVRRLLQIQQDMDYAGNCVNHLPGVPTDLGNPNPNLGTGTPGAGTPSAGTPNDLGSMDVREFFTPVGGATYTVDGVTTPKYTGLTFTIQGELEEGYGTAYKGYKGKGFVGINYITPRTSLRFARYIHNTSTTHIGHWEVLYKDTFASDPVVQFKAQQGTTGTFPPRFLTTKLPDGGPEAPEAVMPFLSTTDDGTKPETHFVLQGTLLECQIIPSHSFPARPQKAIRAAGEVDTVNMTQLLYADAVPGADVARSRWTLGYVKGPLGPDGTIFDRS